MVQGLGVWTDGFVVVGNMWIGDGTMVRVVPRKSKGGTTGNAHTHYYRI